MKKIKTILTLIAAAMAFMLSLASCSNSSGSTSGEETADNPFAGTVWYGDVYDSPFDNEPCGTGELLKFHTQKEEYKGKYYNLVETVNDIHFDAGNQILGNQKLTYEVKETSGDYVASIGIMGSELFKLTVKKDSNTGVIYMNDCGSVTVTKIRPSETSEPTTPDTPDTPDTPTTPTTPTTWSDPESEYYPFSGTTWVNEENSSEKFRFGESTVDYVKGGMAIKGINFSIQKNGDAYTAYLYSGGFEITLDSADAVTATVKSTNVNMQTHEKTIVTSTYIRL